MSKFLGPLYRLSLPLLLKLLTHQPATNGPSALFLAVQKNEGGVAVELLARHASDLSAHDEEGMSLIQLSARNKNIPLFHALIDHGCSCDGSHMDLGGLLTLATEMQDKSTIQMLVDKGADVNGGTHEDEDPLSVDDVPLASAAKNGDFETLKLLIDHHANLNTKFSLGDYATALTCASGMGHLSCVKLLLAAGADVNLSNRFGTALTCAVREKHTDVVRELLAHGADPDSGDYHSSLPLIAASTGDTQIFQMLVQAGADLRTKDRFDQTTLIAAAASGNAAIVRMILSQDHDINFIGGDEQYTALMAAAAEGHADVVEALLESGAKTNIRNVRGDTALKLTQRHGRKNVVELLKPFKNR